MRENLSFILIFSAMMLTLIFLHGCQGLQTENEPAKLACNGSCTADGVCSISLTMRGSNVERSTKVTLDTPTQTKVGLDD